MSDKPRDVPAEIAAMLVGTVPGFEQAVAAATRMLVANFADASDQDLQAGESMAWSVIGHRVFLEMMPCEGTPH